MKNKSMIKKNKTPVYKVVACISTGNMGITDSPIFNEPIHEEENHSNWVYDMGKVIEDKNKPGLNQ